MMQAVSRPNNGRVVITDDPIVVEDEATEPDKVEGAERLTSI